MAARKKAKKAPETFHVEEREGPKSNEGGVTTMGMADEMRGLVQEIQASHEARADRVAAIRQETAGMLKGFRQHLGAMAAELRTFLGHAESSRMEAFRAMFQEIQARQKARKHEVHGFLAGIAHEMGAMAAHWRTLTSTMARKRTGAR